jgi:hypothetical protein
MADLCPHQRLWLIVRSIGDGVFVSVQGGAPQLIECIHRVAVRAAFQCSAVLLFKAVGTARDLGCHHVAAVGADLEDPFRNAEGAGRTGQEGLQKEV